ncbi:MAG: DUF1194 domain-containing protein [Hyphomicrobiales bacterium]
MLRGHNATAQSGEAVDLALVLAIDCSYSVDMREYTLQVSGMAEAFRRPEVVAAIQSGAYRRIAVVVVQWSDLAHQSVVVPRTVISDAASADGLAARLDALPRTLAEGGTSITAALGFSARLLKSVPLQADRHVIDIAADGRNNNGGDPRPMRDAVVAQNITINGLSILNEVPTLDKYFELYVTGGPANFVVVANDYSAYSAAIYRKLLREIIGPRLS